VSDHGATSEAEAGDIRLAEKPTETIPVAGAGVTTPVGIAARPTISVIVCGFTEDRWDDLCRAVRPLHEQTERAREIILVVDHCPGLLPDRGSDHRGYRFRRPNLVVLLTWQ
jgi:hypothetical protein